MVDILDRIKKALFEKGWTQKKLCNEIDISETGLKRMADNNSWKLDTIEKMAIVLDKPIAYFVSDVVENASLRDAPNTNGFNGEKIIRELKVMFEEEIRVKNQQIAGLLKTVDTLAGKSKGTSTKSRNHERVEPRVQKKLGAIVA